LRDDARARHVAVPAACPEPNDREEAEEPEPVKFSGEPLRDPDGRPIELVPDSPPYRPFEPDGIP